jgi:hypothetical protein
MDGAVLTDADQSPVAPCIAPGATINPSMRHSMNSLE